GKKRAGSGHRRWRGSGGGACRRAHDARTGTGTPARQQRGYHARSAVASRPDKAQPQRSRPPILPAGAPGPQPDKKLPVLAACLIFGNTTREADLFVRKFARSVIASGWIVR